MGVPCRMLLSLSLSVLGFASCQVLIAPPGADELEVSIQARMYIAETSDRYNNLVDFPTAINTVIFGSHSRKMTSRLNRALQQVVVEVSSLYSDVVFIVNQTFVPLTAWPPHPAGAEDLFYEGRAIALQYGTRSSSSSVIDTSPAPVSQQQPIVDIAGAVGDFASFTDGSILHMSVAPDDCEAALDLAFLVDGSTSIGTENWPNATSFIERVANYTTIALDKTRVSITTFSSETWRNPDPAAHPTPVCKPGELWNLVRVGQADTAFDLSSCRCCWGSTCTNGGSPCIRLADGFNVTFGPTNGCGTCHEPIGLVNGTREDLAFTNGVSQSAVLSAIENMTLPDGATWTSEGLDFVRTNVFTTAAGMRPLTDGVPRVLVVLTDGKASVGYEPANAARLVRDTGVTIIALRIGTMDADSLEELQSIASSNDLAIAVPTFSQLSGFTSRLDSQTCFACVNGPANTPLIVDVRNEQFRCFSPCGSAAGNVTQVVVTAVNGTANVYLSSTPFGGPRNNTASVFVPARSTQTLAWPGSGYVIFNGLSASTRLQMMMQTASYSVQTVSRAATIDSDVAVGALVLDLADITSSLGSVSLTYEFVQLLGNTTIGNFSVSSTGALRVSRSFVRSTEHPNTNELVYIRATPVLTAVCTSAVSANTPYEIIVNVSVLTVTDAPTNAPVTSAPTNTPTTIAPTNPPSTSRPTPTPTTASPSVAPTTRAPVVAPTTTAPTRSPSTRAPTRSPSTRAPTNAPTSRAPTRTPTTAVPTGVPTTLAPTRTPTRTPTTRTPTTAPTTASPTRTPTNQPSSMAPTDEPSSAAPTDVPSTLSPTDPPTTTPTRAPTTRVPTGAPTSGAPTNAPTSRAPTNAPTSRSPTSRAPTNAPTSRAPTNAPTSRAPTSAPTTRAPTRTPTTRAPTGAPTTRAPTNPPSTSAPSATPTTDAPTETPTTTAPTSAPSTQTPTAATTAPLVVTTAGAVQATNPNKLDTPYYFWGCCGEISIPENETAGFVVASVSVRDAAGDTVSEVTFSLTGAPGTGVTRHRRASLPFAIEVSTGVITLTEPVDYETHAWYDLLVAASLGVTPLVESKLNATVAAVACPPGLWSPSGTYACSTAKACENGQIELAKPTPSTDRQCAEAPQQATGDNSGSNAGATVGYIFAVLILLCLLLLLAVMVLKRRRQKDNASRGQGTMNPLYDQGGATEMSHNPLYSNSGGGPPNARDAVAVNATYTDTNASVGVAEGEYGTALPVDNAERIGGASVNATYALAPDAPRNDAMVVNQTYQDTSPGTAGWKNRRLTLSMDAGAGEESTTDGVYGEALSQYAPAATFTSPARVDPGASLYSDIAPQRQDAIPPVELYAEAADFHAASGGFSAPGEFSGPALPPPVPPPMVPTSPPPHQTAVAPPPPVRSATTAISVDATPKAPPPPPTRATGTALTPTTPTAPATPTPPAVTPTGTRAPPTPKPRSVRPPATSGKTAAPMPPPRAPLAL